MSQEKQVIYLEADAEITEAIDKLRAADASTVQIVVPGRSSLLQSVVNLKLLKKAAKDHKKELVLVTGDKTAKNLAGKVGLAVAASVGATAVIPEIPESDPEPDIVEKIAQEPPVEPSSDAVAQSDKAAGSTKPAPVMSKRALSDGEEKKSSKKDKKTPKVPNFNLFQKKMVWIGGAIGLILLVLILVFFVQPVKTTVIAKAQKKPINVVFTLSPSSTTSNPEDGVVAAKQISLDKDYKASFTATGKKDVGTKASGSAAIKNCEDSDPISLPVGSKLTASGKTFVSTAAATIPGGNFSNGGQTCNSSAANIQISAEQNGDSYNLSGASFSVAGVSSRVSGSGSTSGGTSKTVTVVSQGDIDGAKKKMLEGGSDSAKNELFDKVGKNSVLFEQTFKANESSFSSSAPAGSEAENGTITAKISYVALTATNKDVEALLLAQLKGEVPNNFEVYDNGLGSLKYTTVSPAENDTYKVSGATTAFIGEKIDEKALAAKLTGKSKKDVSDIAKSFNPSIVSATASGWPLVPNMPLLAGNIKIEIKVDTTSN